jgi:hypothetical protein
VRVEVTVKVKANMPFKKIFEVAEVCVALYVLSHAHFFSSLSQKRFGKDPGALFYNYGLTSFSKRSSNLTCVGSLRFVYDGERLSPTETPAEVCHNFSLF